jgi:hypothetical protein
VARFKARRWMVPLLLVGAGVLACTVPLLVAFAEATARIPGTGSPPRSITGVEIPYTLLTYVVGYSFGPSVRDIQNDGALAALAGHGIEGTLAIATVLAILLLIVGRRHPSMAGFIAVAAGYVLATTFAAAVTGKAYSVRYALPGVIGFLGLTSIAIQRLPAPGRRAWLGFLLLLFGVADVQWFFVGDYQKDDSRGAAALLSDRLPAGSTVEVAPAYAAPILAHYARPNKHLRFTPAGPQAWAVSSPAGLVLTRLHHVPDPEALVAAFRDRAGDDAEEHALTGYRVFIDTASPTTTRRRAQRRARMRATEGTP